MPMHIHPLIRKPSSLQISPLVTNSMLSFEVSTFSKNSQNTLHNKCQPKTFIRTLIFKTLIEQGSALVYLDNILLLSNSKEHMFHLIEQLHIISTKHNLKLAPEKSFFMLLKVKNLGHEIGYNTIIPIHSKIASLHKIPSPTGKVALMSFIGALTFYTNFIEQLHIKLKPFYELLLEHNPWKRNDEHETLFHKLKMAPTAETEFTVPNTKHRFFNTGHASLNGIVGLGAVLFHFNEDNKMKVIPYNSRILNQQEQNSPHLIENSSVRYMLFKLTNFSLLIPPIHSAFSPITNRLHCSTEKGNLGPQFYRTEMQLTKFSKFHTPGKNLYVADMFSRSFTIAELQINQLRHKQLPPQIDFAILQNNTLKTCTLPN